MQDVIRMTYDVALCHPDEITKIWSLSHPDDLGIPNISSGWLIVDALCHPDDLPGVGISSGWVTANSLCHPDDILFHLCHPDDLPDVGISSGWVTANSLCHPDDILFHFMSSGWLSWGWIFHPDELRQCYYVIRMRYASFLKSSEWDSKFRFSTTRGGPSALPYIWLRACSVFAEHGSQSFVYWLIWWSGQEI